MRIGLLRQHACRITISIFYFFALLTDADSAYSDEEKQIPWFYYSKADGTKLDMGAQQLSDLHVANLTLPLH